MKRYRVKWWYLAVALAAAIGSLALLGGVIAFALASAGISIFGYLFNDQRPEFLVPMILFCALSSILGALLVSLGIIVPLGNALFSYLGIGSTGIEVRSWPNFRMNCAWKDVIGVESVRIIRNWQLPMIKVRQAEIVAWPGILGGPGPFNVNISESDGINNWLLMTGPPLLMLLFWPGRETNLVPLVQFRGWPMGDLREELENRIGPISLS